MRIPTIQATALPQLCTDDLLDSRIRRRDRCREEVTAEIMKVSRKPLKLCSESHDERLVDCAGFPAPPGTRASDKSMSTAQLVEVLGPRRLPRLKSCQCHAEDTTAPRLLGTPPHAGNGSLVGEVLNLGSITARGQASAADDCMLDLGVNATRTLGGFTSVRLSRRQARDACR